MRGLGLSEVVFSENKMFLLFLKRLLEKIIIIYFNF
jgi:hypothetical protein